MTRDLRSSWLVLVVVAAALIGAGLRTSPAAAAVSTGERVSAAAGRAPAISAGYHHTRLLVGDDTARCWGSNSFGQLGDGTTEDRATPVTVVGLTGAVAITAGRAYTCALINDGTARCWGYNGSGQRLR